MRLEKKLFLRQTCIIFVFLASVMMQSVSANSILDEWLGSDTIAIIVGETKTLSVKNPTQVKITNPSLIDIKSAGKEELLLSGLQEGETTLSVVDSYGKRKYIIEVFAEDLEKVKERIDILLDAAGYYSVDTRIGFKERKIFLTGNVSATQQEDFQKKIGSIQDKIIDLISYEEALSVQIDVEVLEIGKTDLDNLGVQWNKSFLFEEGGVSGGVVTDNFVDELLDPTQFFKIMKDWRTGTFSAQLNFLKQNNKARTLSRPKLVCLSGKEAKLLVGGERPIVSNSTTTTGSGTSTQSFDVELKEYGIILTIKPVVKNNQEIVVELQTEITEVDETQSLALGSGVSTPGFTERSAQTELTVVNGQTIFLAGLISSKRTDDRDGIAGLEKIPFLGALFRHRDLQQRDTEIVITLTPTIIGAQQPALPSKVQSTRLSPAAQYPMLSRSNQLSQAPTMGPQEDSFIQSYSQLVQSIIYSNMEYPYELQGMNVQGTVKLSLHVQANGELLGVVVMRSSGNELLDEAAQRTVKKLAPFPAFPKSLRVEELWIDMPIVYKLTNRM